MLAIISDIHANLEALDAVLADIRRREIDDLICLGDVVGYGPDPVECMRRASKWPVVVAGDWDRAIVDHDPTQWIDQLNRYVERTHRAILEAPDGKELLAAAASFQNHHEQYGYLFCHGTPSDVRAYLFPEDSYNERKLARIGKEFDRVLFVGHTHLPGLIVQESSSQWEYIEVEDNDEYDLHGYAKAICNPGSVGQPRDGDSRASYAVLDRNTIKFHRVDYDIDKTIAKIKDDPDSDDMQGNRLPEGR